MKEVYISKMRVEHLPTYSKEYVAYYCNIFQKKDLIWILLFNTMSD